MVPALCLLALAAAPSPHSLVGADFAVFSPRLDRAATLRPYLERAGQKAILLRPQSWQGEFHPLLHVDPTRPESLEAAGIDPAGAATVSARGQVRLSCAQLADVGRFKQRVGERLATLGASWKGRAEGLALTGAMANGKVVAAYALKGKDSCSLAGPGFTEKEAGEAARALNRPAPEWKAALAAPGPVKVLSQGSFAGLTGDERSLTGEGRLSRQPLPALRGAGASPYAQMEPSGLAFVLARLEPSALPSLAEGLAARLVELCPECDPAEVQRLAKALAPLLTGAVALKVEKVKVAESLRSEPGRFFALRHAYLAELSRPEEAQRLLAPVGRWGHARALADGFAVKARGGELIVGAKGPHLFLGNDEAVVTELLAAVPAKPGRLAHGAEVVADPKRVARGLSQIPLLDVLGSQELAALFAVGTELGPLLAASERLDGWLESSGPTAHAFRATWTLPAASAPDAGR